ncbi:hypothetical protein ICV32_01560 [Polynucleobacter sp. MWH-UH24A]|uniref:hypothetical protein n=1 Tax=Polynucleobacter sp. MWH-UH24A TaxID=2689110 RepID=UPI001BFE6F0F|nr:hypothetical protein [Polynucleobacter sp. MWH-UH24A]QWD76387.1 hypothetical protein ICV32_01560 [Polynucleobacter sp. MWH-UH24A]
MSQRFIIDYDNPDAGIGHSMGFINRGLKIALRNQLQLAYAPAQLRKSSRANWRWRLKQGLRKLRGAQVYETHNLGDDLNRMLNLAQILPRRNAVERRIRQGELRVITLPQFQIPIPTHEQIDDEVYRVIDTFIQSHPEPNTVFRLKKNPTGDYEYASTRTWLRSAYDKARQTDPIALLYPPGSLHIAVHIRRGDLLPGRQYADLASRMLPDRWYLEILDLIMAQVHQPLTIHIFSEGKNGVFHSETGEPFSWMHYYKDSGHQVVEHIDTPFLETFHHLLQADYFIGSKSGMTHLAGMLSHSIKLVPSMWHSYRGADHLCEVPDILDVPSKRAITQFLAHHPPANQDPL